MIETKKISAFFKGRRKTILLWGIAALIAIIYWFSLPRQLFDVPHSTILLAKDGELLGARIAADGQWRFPPSDSIPYKLSEAMIAFEDDRFRYHPGIDPAAVVRAVRNNLRSGAIEEGASTITMQVIRLSRGSRERTFGRKVSEAILATRLELTHSKRSILSLYAANAPFGGNVVGAEAAAWRYFGRNTASLSWAEAATLAVLPNAPSLIHVAKNRPKLLEKRNRLLEKLARKGIIDSLKCELAKEEPLPDKPHPMPMYAPHLLDRVASDNPSGTSLRSTLDSRTQRRTDDIARTFTESYKANHINNMAILVAEVSTGNIIAYVGNIYDLTDQSSGSNVDVITAPRSSGSILKPVLYAAMLDEGLILPGSLVSDTPFYLKSFSPKNFNRRFDGLVPAHRVLERSLNVPTVRMLQQYGVEKFLNLLQKSGFSTINRSADNYGLTLVLGGAETTLWDAITFYSAAAHKLTAERKTDEPFGGLRFDTTATRPPLDIQIGKAALWQTFESLSDLTRPEEEGEWQVFGSSRRVAWKTGTSYGNRDAWSIGITPEYVVGVWVGNADGEGRPNLTGINYAAPVMFEVFNTLPRSGWFDMPEIEMEQTVVCRKSGYVALPICPDKDTVWTTSKGAESNPCPFHKELTLSSDGAYRVTSDCYDVNQMIRRVWFVPPPTEEWYYRRTAPDYSPPPPLHPSCAGRDEKTMELIYPGRGTIVVVPRKLDGSEGGVVLHAIHRTPQSVIFWHIDDNFIGQTSGEHKITVNPEPGNHTLTLVDETGKSLKSTFRVEK